MSGPVGCGRDDDCEDCLDARAHARDRAGYHFHVRGGMQVRCTEDHTNDPRCSACDHLAAKHADWSGDSSGKTKICYKCQDYPVKNVSKFHHLNAPSGNVSVPDRLPDDIRNMKSQAVYKPKVSEVKVKVKVKVKLKEKMEKGLAEEALSAIEGANIDRSKIKVKIKVKKKSFAKGLLLPDAPSSKDGLVVLVRHPETALNADQRLRGWLDVPLNEKGQRQTDATADRVNAKYRVHRVVSSDLQRAYVLGNLIAQRAGLVAELTPNLRPWNLGDMQGKPANEVDPEMLKYIKNPDVACPNGESWNTFGARALALFGEILMDARRSGQTIVLVTHTRNLRLFLGWVHGRQEGEKVDTGFLTRPEDPLPTAGDVALVFDGQRWGEAKGSSMVFKARKTGYSVKDGFGLTPAKTKGVNTVEECGDCGFAGTGSHKCALPNKSMAIYKSKKPHPHSLQGMINSGHIWGMEGSAGRGAVDAIKGGEVALGHQGHRDYYGNYVPSRHELKPNAPGSAEFVQAHGGTVDPCSKLEHDHQNDTAGVYRGWHEHKVPKGIKAHHHIDQMGSIADVTTPEIPDQLPRSIRNMKKSQVIFKSEDQYERCGACDHPRGNHSGHICHECFKNNGSSNPIIAHAFQAKPGITGRVGVPSRSQRLDTILSLREKFHGTATDKTEKSRRIWKAKSATMYTLQSQKTGRVITHVANIGNESSHVFGGGGRIHRDYSNASVGRMLRMRDRSSGVMGKIRQKFGAPKLIER